MASTEEVLSTLLADDYIHSSIQFLIDENMRTVTVPPEGVVLGVTGDKDVNRINFKMVRFYDGLDLSTFQIRINYVNANGDANYYQVTDTTIEDDYILFTWLVSSDAAAYKGTVSFAARLYTVEDTIVKESFNSTVATAEVLEGIIVDEYMPPDAQQDLIALLMSQIKFPAGSNVGQIDDTEGASAHGEIFNDYTRNEATGGMSHAEGNSTTASGANSHAEGSDTTASGNCAHAEGYMTTASGARSHAEGGTTNATGQDSHAEGWHTTASGSSSHSEGDQTYATGKYSHSEGYNTKATSDCSHAEGFYTEASGRYSHVEGIGTKASSEAQHVSGKSNVEDAAGMYAMIIGNGIPEQSESNAFTLDWDGNIQCGKTDTSGNFTTYGTVNGVDVTTLSGGSGVGQVDATEGSDTHGEIFNDYERNEATGSYSHAEGFTTTASGSNSHAEGNDTIASGMSSHAEGSTTEATGNFTHAEGSGTKASSAYQHVQGKYNVEDSANTYAMIIGNGTSDTARSNAFTVDWSGNVECGTVNGIDVTQLSSGGSEVGQIDTTEGASHHGEIFNNYKNGYYFKNKATGLYSHAEGSDTTASGDFSHAEGYTAKATGDFSHAEGSGTTAAGAKSHAEGDSTTASGDESHAEGTGTTASNTAAHTEGGYTSASGSYSHAEGYQARATGNYSHAEGYTTKASSANQHVQGKYNVEDTAETYAMIIGNGSSNTACSNCFTIDWNGNIQCGKTDTDGNFTAYGTINGVDITRISSGGGSGVGQVDGNNHGEIFNAYSGSGKNVATGSYAHAEGYKTSATGSGSHAEGNVTVAYGQNSHAEGYYTYAAISEQHVQGRYNVKDTDGVYAMIIGNGTGDDTRSNRFTVDWNGNVQCGKTDTSGNFTTNGTINGIDIVALAARVAALEGGTS